jgi:ubiquitin carboxyl-terminal hydrolase 44/49
MTNVDKENEPEYSLRAVVVHHGKYFSSGHYTTFCWNDSESRKNSSGWVQYNDSEVTGAKISDVLQSQAYMLLYVDTDLANDI